MKIRNLAASLLALSLAAPAFAQTEAKFALPSSGTPGPHPVIEAVTINEDFADITTLPGAGWSLQNLSNPLGTTDWFQGNAGNPFDAQAGALDSYIGANFNNTTGATGITSNWLITPEVNFGTGATLRFWTRVPTGGSQFPDRLEVRLSSAGPSTNVGATEATVGDFTTVLATINPSLLTTAGTCPPGTGGYPEDWCEIVLTNAEGIPTSGTGRIGLRYFVDNAGPSGANSNFVGVDTLSYDEGTIGGGGGGIVLPPPAQVPTLSQIGLIAMFLALVAGAGLSLRRRRS